MKPTINLFLDTRVKIKSKGDRHPLSMRVTVSNKSNRSWRLGFFFTEDEYKKAEANKNREAWREMWADIDSQTKRAEKIVRELEPFSYEEFKERFFGERYIAKVAPDEASVNHVLERVCKDYLKKEQYPMTVKLRDSVNSILKFSKTENLPMRSITPKFCRDYENYMVKKSHKKTRNGAGINMRHIRILFNQAIAMELIPRSWYPFKRESGEKSEFSDPYVIPYEQKVKEFLKEDELLTMFKASNFITEAQKRAHDAWLISFYCNGCNAADFLEFRYRNIQGDFIIFYRQKVKNATRSDSKPVKVYLSPELKELIEKIGNLPRPDNYIFDVYKPGMTVEQKYDTRKQFVSKVSQSLKHLADNLGIKKNLRLGNARHSLANVLKKNGVDREILKDLFGHTSIITADNYFGQFEEDKHAEIAKNFISFGSIEERLKKQS